ncbi:MAG: DUF285 domain-containing protein, partial [Erysipelotrichaceae bacterium]|nr:DUF285 domain-containing protein [Erysipelotrichaceae bacterium]
MKKLIKLLLVGLLSISLVGCSNSSSDSSNDDTSSDTTEAETSSDDSGDKVVTSSGNVMQADPNESELNESAFGTLIDPEDVKTVTFLDNENALPFEIDDNIESYDISENDDGCVMLYAQPTTQNADMYNIYIVGDGGVDANPSCKYLFVKFTNLTSVNFNDCFYTSNATNMCGMFENCESLTSLDLSGFDTSNVTDMQMMFYECES